MPVIVSVPHAGRDYPDTLLVALRPSPPLLKGLEDRHVDAVALAARNNETMLVQRRGRAWIDLNREERERDPRVDAGAAGADAVITAKTRSGLGLVPRRATGVSELWRRRWTGAEIDARIEADHRPYHLTLARLLMAARARFGVAVLLDLHSMPSLGAGQPQVVIGDRFGRSAGARFIARAEAELAGAGLRIALNSPYAGGHIVERHGRPHANIHAIQLELDRALYLDGRMDLLGDGLAATASLVRRLLDGLNKEALGRGAALAEAAE